MLKAHRKIMLSQKLELIFMFLYVIHLHIFKRIKNPERSHIEII